MRVALDLFCGTGGATAAFRAAGWNVVGVDIDARRYPDVIADVRRLPFAGRVDFIWLSPPCNEFSTMPPGRDDRRPSLDLVFAALSAVRDLRPKFWILENVRGALPFLGVPRQKIGPFCLWGYFPKIKAPIEVVEYRKMVPKNRNAVDRAAIPYALSLAVLTAVERSWKKKSIVDLRPYRRHRQIAKLNRVGPAWRPPEGGHVAGGRGCTSDDHVAVQLDGHMVGDPGETATWPGHDRGEKAPA